MTYFYRINAPKTKGIYVSESEILKMLMKNQDIYRIGLERGKIFGRAESKKKQYEKKYSKHESDTLNKFLE